MRVRCWVLGLWVVGCGVVVLLFVSSVCSREIVEKRKNEQIGAPS